MAKDLKESGSSGSKTRMSNLVKKRLESTGLRKRRGIDNSLDGWDRYESTSYAKKGKYKGG